MTSYQVPIFRWWLGECPASVSLEGIRASDHEAGAVSRGAAGAARRARSPGCRVRLVVSRMPLSTRAAKATDARGRFDDESR